MIGYKAPSRKTVRNQLNTERSRCYAELIEKLKSVESIAVTFDFWSDRKQKSYLCMTGHFLANNEFKSTVLAFNTFSSRHTSGNIAKTIEANLKTLGIDKKVTTMTCDGASNIKKALELLAPQRIQCFAHKLHLVVCNALGFWSKSSGKKRERKHANILAHDDQNCDDDASDAGNHVNDSDGDDDDDYDDIIRIDDNHEIPIDNQTRSIISY